MEGHNWFLNHFVEIPHRLLLISFGKSRFKPPAMGDQLFMTTLSEPVFVNLLRSQGIDSQPGGIISAEFIPGLLKRLQIRAQYSGGGEGVGGVGLRKI
jgi:hypothetical protein